MRKLTLVAAMATVIGAGALGACATLGLGGWKQPVVNLKDVRVRGLGMTGGTVDVVLSVYNPNGYRLDGTRLTYKLMVDSVPFGQGATDNRFTVNSNDSTEVTLPLDFTYTGLSAATRDLMNKGTVNYRVLGDVTVGTALGNHTFAYDRTGRFSTFGSGTR